MVDENIEVVKIDTGEQKKKNLVRIVGLAILVIAIIVLIVVRVNNPDSLPAGKLLLIGGGILVFGVLIFYSFELTSKLKKLEEKAKDDDKLPKPSSEEQVIERIHKFITNDRHNGFQNHIKSFNSKEYNINKNKIYVFSIVLLYPDEILGKEIYVIVNAHFISDIPTILPRNTSPTLLWRQINLLSTNPRNDPEVEESITYNPITGTEVKHKKTSHKSNLEKEKQKQEKDIE